MIVNRVGDGAGLSDAQHDYGPSRTADDDPAVASAMTRRKITIIITDEDVRCLLPMRECIEAKLQRAAEIDDLIRRIWWTETKILPDLNTGKIEKRFTQPIGVR